MSRRELAEKVGLKESTLYLIETDFNRKNRASTLGRIAKALGVPLSTLYENNSERLLTNKDCLNQSCLLNKCKKCQSIPVAIRGESCQNQSLVTDKKERIISCFVLNYRSRRKYEKNKL